MPSAAWILTALLLFVSWGLFAFVYYEGGGGLATETDKIPQEKKEWLKHAPLAMAVGIPVIVALAVFVPMMMHSRTAAAKGGAAGAADENARMPLQQYASAPPSEEFSDYGRR